jgi:competence protein ComEC
MISTTLGFVFGAWCLQQQSALPPAMSILLLLPAYGELELINRFSRFPVTFFCIASRFIFAALCGFFYAAVFASLRLGDALPHEWEQKNIELQGIVSNLPELTERGERFQFDVERILTPSAVVPRHISLNYYRNSSRNPQDSHSPTIAPTRLFHAGERWRLTVRLRRPHSTYNPHGFDLEAWALSENIRAIGSIKGKGGIHRVDESVFGWHYFIERCRERVAERISRVLQDQPYVGVIRALVIGDESQVGAQNWNVFLRTGISHLISISGLHITMLASLAYGLVAFVWRRVPQWVQRVPTPYAATLGAMLVALLYACLAGLSVPTQRTVLMLGIFAVAIMSGRRFMISQVLALALGIVVLADPWAVNAPGFWLSFGAIAMIAYVTAHRQGVSHWLKAAVNTQWAVTIGLLPLLIALFGQASIVSPIANAFAIPLVSLGVVPLALLGALLPFDFALQAAHALFAMCLKGLLVLSQTQLATWQQATPPTWTIVLAMLGVLWMLLPKGLPQRWLGLVLILPMLLVQPKTPAIGEMRVAVLDVGQGLSVVVHTAKHALLFDAGPLYSSQSDAGSKIIVPFLRGEGIFKLDGVIVSHQDDDHSGGAASVLAQLPVTWLAASYDLPTETLAKVLSLHCVANQHWQWDEVRFEMLHPTLASYQDSTIKDNNRGCVLKVTSRYGSVLLSADIEKEAELALLDNRPEALRSDVLIVPHHGSSTSSTSAFIQAVGARDVIFTVGYLNRFQHPKPEVVQRYLDTGAHLLRSDYQGEIDIAFADNAPIQLIAWRQRHKRYWQDDYEYKTSISGK